MPALLRGGTRLARWTLAGGAAAHAPPAWRLQLRWQAWWFDKLWRQQTARITATRPGRDPVLVLGLWRSGTTLLHDRLSALPGLQAPLTWQCFSPSTFMLTGAPGGPPAAEVRRPMDGGSIGPQSAQEDEFALLLLGARSLYCGFIDPRRLPALADDLFLAEGAEAQADGSDDWAADWLRFLAGVEAQGGGTRLVLKSPNHTLRLAALRRLMPDSPQVWIGRPLPEVWQSNLRMWQAMFAQYALWPCPPGVLEDFLARCVERYLAALAQALDHQPAHLACWVDFSDLSLHPGESLQALARFLGVPAQAGVDDPTLAIVQCHPAQEATTPSTPLPGRLAAANEAVERLHVRARQQWGWRAHQ